MVSCNRLRVTVVVQQWKRLVVQIRLSALPSHQDVVVHEFATLCLALMSVDYICKVKIFESNGLPPLIQLLASPDPDVKKNSLEIIFNAAQVTSGELSPQNKNTYKSVERAVVCIPCMK